VSIELEVTERSFCVATSRNLVVFSWRALATVEQVRACGRASRGLARRKPGGTGAVNLIAGGVPRFTDEVRREAERLRADPSLSPLGRADVVLVDGFAGVAARGFMSTVTLLGKSGRPHRVFGDVRSAGAWLAPKLSAGGEPWTSAEVEEVVRQVEAAHATAP
jgi:hypothetical protein